jgi:hypothetical protein
MGEILVTIFHISYGGDPCHAHISIPALLFSIIHGGVIMIGNDEEEGSKEGRRQAVEKDH